MEHCISGGCHILQKYSGNASGRQTPYLYVTPMQNCKSFVPAGALEQRMWLCFSYDHSHVAYAEMKLMWVWILASPSHHSMKKRELNSCPINKERIIPLQRVTVSFDGCCSFVVPNYEQMWYPTDCFSGKRWVILLNVFNISLLQLTLQT